MGAASGLAHVALLVCGGMVMGTAHATDVRILTQRGLDTIAVSENPAFLMLEPPTKECDGCEAMGVFWDMIGKHFPKMAWKVACSTSKKVCAKTGIFEDSRYAMAPQPVFARWTGTAFERYNGKKDPEALLEYIRSQSQSQEALIQQKRIAYMRKLFTMPPDPASEQ